MVIAWLLYVLIIFIKLISLRLRLVTFSETRGTNRKGTYRNKIAGMKRNACSLSNLTRNAFVLYFSTKKGMEMNKKEKLFLVNVDFFLE